VQPACSVLILPSHPGTCASPPAVHDVPSGLISINVSFAGTQIYEEVDDLCSKTTCPIKTGPLDITYVQDLPPIAPPVSCLGSTSGLMLVHSCIFGLMLAQLCIIPDRAWLTSCCIGPSSMHELCSADDTLKSCNLSHSIKLLWHTEAPWAV
jgi:hypothetical protein